MNAPHILLVNVFFAPFSYGGATVVAEQVARCLQRDHACQISVVSACHRHDLVPYHIIKSQTDGITNYLINLPHHRSYSELYDNPNVTEILARLMDQLQPDLLHAHCVQELGVGMFQAAKDRGIPTVLSVHDFWWLCDRQFMIKPNQSYCGQSPIEISKCRGCVEDFSAAKTRYQTLGRIADCVDVITYPSQFALDLSEKSGFGAGKGVVWKNGVTLPKHDFFDKQAARRKADPRCAFGFLGGPSQIKGWPLIRQAFIDIDRDDFKGYLVDGSRDGTWWPGQDISRLHGDWSVYPRFEQEQMDDFYANIDVLLFMSQWKETFGLAIREAAARGISVIQTDSGGTVEHPNVVENDLLKIGEGPARLQAQIERAIDRKRSIPVPQVTSFAGQADEFIALSEPLLAHVS